MIWTSKGPRRSEYEEMQERDREAKKLIAWVCWIIVSLGLWALIFKWVGVL